MSLESGKTLGGIGAILIAIGSFFPLLSLIGIILVLVAMKRLAEYYKDNEIFDNALLGFIFGLIGIIGAIVVFFLLFLSGTIWAISLAPFAAIGGIIVAVIVWFVFSVLQAIYYRRSFSILSEKTGEKMFDTAGLLLFIGAILTIILIGGLVLLIAWILAAIAFFAIKTPAAQPLAPASPQAPDAPPADKIYCQYCRTENRTDAVFCKKCGKRIGKE